MPYVPEGIELGAGLAAPPTIAIAKSWTVAWVLKPPAVA